MQIKTVYIDSAVDQDLRPPKGKPREYVFVQNLSTADIYYAEGTLATSENGIAIGAAQFLELDMRTGGIPQGILWLRGSSAPGTRQRVLVKEA